MDQRIAEDLKTSLFWAEVLKEIDRKIVYESRKLLTCLPEDLKEIQIRIACYESLKSLPDDILDREA